MIMIILYIILAVISCLAMLIWGICIYEIIKNELRYGWGTLYTLYNLHKRKLYGLNDIDLDCRITIDNTDVYILLDPISFTMLFGLGILQVIYKKIKTIRVTKILKTYSRVESEIIMDKLTKE